MTAAACTTHEHVYGTHYFTVMVTVSRFAVKLNRGACTQLPVTGENYWTGGCEGFACQWFSQGCAIGCAACTGEWTRNECTNGTLAQPTLAQPC